MGESCEALLLTPKARVVALLIVWRRGVDDFLLLTEPEAGERLARELVRSRFAAKCEIGLEEHRSLVVLGRRTSRWIITSRPAELATTACRRSSCVDGEAPGDALSIGEDELERLRILARTPRLGREVDDRVMPAEAGLDQRAISFTKGCYPGQEPVARLHYRGHPNRGLRVLSLEGGELPVVRRRARARRKGRREGDERGPRPGTRARRARLRAARSPTRCPLDADRSLRATAQRLAVLDEPPRYTHLARARSSGDRALPCGGRGRKFESCRAHGGGGTHCSPPAPPSRWGNPMVPPPTPSFCVVHWSPGLASRPAEPASGRDALCIARAYSSLPTERVPTFSCCPAATRQAASGVRPWPGWRPSYPAGVRRRAATSSSRSPGATTRGSSRCSASKEPLDFAHSSTGSPSPSASCGPSATTPAGSSTSRSATATRPCCGASGSPPGRPTATRCSRRYPRSEAAVRSTHMRTCATPAGRG